MVLDDDVNYEELEKKIPKIFTGADFYGLTSQTLIFSVKNKIKEIE